MGHSGDTHKRRYNEVATLAQRPLPTSTSLRNGDRIFSRFEEILSTLVGPPGARFWFEEHGSAQALGFGNGIDGAVVFPLGITTLTHDIYATTVLVPNGAHVLPNGFKIVAQQSIQIDLGGVIDANGTNGAGSVPGVGPAKGTLAGGTSGGAGSIGAGVGAPGVAQSTGMITPVGGVGGDGGAGGVNAGGLGGAVPTSALQGTLNLLSNAINGSDAGPFGIVSPGSGGGGGGSDNALATGGGGGGGAGIILLAAPRITNNGTLAAFGGQGAAGVAAAGAAGGGGGGGGGVVIRVAAQLNGAGSILTLGGAGGLGAGGGIGGVIGAPGMTFAYLF